MFCSKCGKEIVDGSVFCSFCGERVVLPENKGSIDPQASVSDSKDDYLSQKEFDPSGVQYYDPYEEEVVKKGKSPICGRIGLGLYLGAVTLRVIIGLKSGGSFISTLTVSVALTPLIILLIISALTLAIISNVRKERGSSANITIGLIIVSVLYYVISVVTKF